MSSRLWQMMRVAGIDVIGSVFWFPVWWYTSGFSSLIRWFSQSVRYRIRAYSFRIWVRNFFVPMYGQRDLLGRVISVGMRFVVLLFRSVVVFTEACVYVVASCVWLAVLPVSCVLTVVTIARFLYA